MQTPGDPLGGLPGATRQRGEGQTKEERPARVRVYAAGIPGRDLLDDPGNVGTIWPPLRDLSRQGRDQRRGSQTRHIFARVYAPCCDRSDSTQETGGVS